jgi:signal peptidase I
VRSARRLAGVALTVLCGWGVLLTAYFLTSRRVIGFNWPLLTVGVLDLGLFLVLEHNYWLSRLMGLRVWPRSLWWLSAASLCVLGPVGLLFRSSNPEPSSATDERARAAADVQQPDTFREVIETVVFVVVLVLLLKSFVAEAFVIPTGSMAETLYGYQKTVRCPDCGIEFEVNCSREVDSSDGQPLEPIIGCTCPNCRRSIRFLRPPDQPAPNAPPRSATDEWWIPDPDWNSGDRVLVAKPVYDMLGKPPDRLDVVVFKFPGEEGSFPSSGPYRSNVPMNYIKRLIGKPGETIAIHNGKVFVLSPDKGLRYPDYEEAKGNPDQMAQLWQKRYMHVNDAGALAKWNDGQFQIIRKDPDTLQAMMRLVFDNDHPGRGQPERWNGEADGWKPEGRGFRADAGSDLRWLHYSHLCNRETPTRRELITDFMGYNTFVIRRHDHPPGQNWVGDLILECEVELADKPTGELVLDLAKGADRFQARWDLGSADGLCTLYRISKGREQKLESKPTGLRGGGTYRLRFANVDERLVVWVDGQLPFDQGVTYQAVPRGSEGPRPENDLEPANIGVRGAAVKVRGLRLYRDTYYTTAAGGSPGNPDYWDSNVRFDNPDTWDPLRHLPVLTMYVPQGHYLCLGDNSPESSDSRIWGTVPERLLLGRAVLVYYPFGRAGRIR